MSQARQVEMSGTVVGEPYSKFAIYHANHRDVDDSAQAPFPFNDGVLFRAVNTGIDEPGVQVNWEAFYPGQVVTWSLFHDELQYVTSGSAEITYHLAPTFHETGTVVAKPGSIYLMPRGCRVVWRILGDEPFRHLCICVPNPGYGLPIVRGGGAS